MKRSWLARLNDPRDTRAAYTFAACLLVAEALLCWGIIAKVPYTEIDWEAYMQEVSGFLEGERNYENLKGDTGPLVYPAGFVYVFAGLKWLTGGQVAAAQIIFAVVYLLTQSLVMLVFIRTQALAPWSLVLICISRRLHSIYVLRLFNDCWAMLLAYGATALLQNHQWALAVVVYSAAVSIKMNVLLFAPGVFAVLIKAGNPLSTVRGVAAGMALQALLALPFLLVAPRGYLTRAFEFTRTFQMQWSVNWQFLPPKWFVDPRFALILLALHLRFLWSFARYRWFQAEGGPLEAFKSFMKRKAGDSAAALSSDFMLYILFTSNLAGILTSRTLHFQFYSWYFHTLPYLLLRTRIPIGVSIGILVCIEGIWNLYPPSAAASAILLFLHSMVLAAVWSLPAPPPAPVTKVLGKRPRLRGTRK